MPQLPRRELLLYFLLWPLLALRHLSLYYQGTEFAHFDHIVWNLERLLGGTMWVKGPNLWETPLQLGGPLYYWLHLPALLFEQPVMGLHIYYGLLEMAAITFFLVWALRRPALLPRELVWAAGLFLALFGDGKLVIAENMTIATYLAVALFMAALRGLHAPRARGMLLPGLLLGATTQVHLATLYLAPVLVAAVVLERRDRGLRLLWLLAGWLAVVAVLLPGVLNGVPGGGQMDHTLATLTSRFELSRVALRLAFALHDPLSLLGLGLALVAWIRGRAGAVERLAVLWFVAGYVALGMALSYMSLNWNESRFATVNPARAILDGLALIWLCRAANRIPLVARAVKAAPAPVTLLLGAAVLALVALGSLTAYKRAEAQETTSAKTATPCRCDLWAHETDARQVSQLVDRIQQVGVPPLDAARLVVSGPVRERMEAVLHWLNRDRRLALQAQGKGGSGANLLATPALPKFDLTRIRGAVDYGPFLLLPRSLPVSYKPVAGEGTLSFDLKQVPGDHRLVMITLHGDTGSSAPRSEALLLGGQPLERADACRCDAGQEYRRYADWILYRIPTSAGPNDTFTIRLGEGYKDREALWVVALPPEDKATR